MKNNVIYLEEMYQTIRKSFLKAMPYTLGRSDVEANFLQVYVGKWVEHKEFSIKLHTKKLTLSGAGVDYVRTYENEGPYATSNDIRKAQTALIFESQPDQCKHLCDDITAMIKWLELEGYILNVGAPALPSYQMTTKFLDKESLK